MTLFVSFRTSAVAGSVAADPSVLESRPPSTNVTIVGATLPVARIAGRHVVFATHGFNVSQNAGVRVLAGLEAAMALPARFTFVGVLWPGDYWIPVVNYPSEADDAVRCGARLARFINGALSSAASVSFVSHSLGARLVFEAVANLDRPAEEVCVLAAAVDDDCLVTRQYSSVCTNARRVSVLSSRKDWVLWLAYPVGDFASDVVYDDDSPWRAALGYGGPRPRRIERVAPREIPTRLGIGHLGYLPSSAGLVENYVRDSLSGLTPGWP